MKSLAAVSGTSLSCHNCLVETHCGNCHGIQSREETNVLLWSPTAASWRRMKKGKHRQLCGEAFAIWGQNCRPSHHQQQHVYQKSPINIINLPSSPHTITLSIEEISHSFPQNRTIIEATKASLAFCWDGWRVALRPSSLASFLRSPSP